MLASAFRSLGSDVALELMQTPGSLWEDAFVAVVGEEQ
jgi:hypothetical protein